MDGQEAEDPLSITALGAFPSVATTTLREQVVSIVQQSKLVGALVIAAGFQGSVLDRERCRVALRQQAGTFHPANLGNLMVALVQ
jgi:hypothetical protein